MLEAKSHLLRLKQAANRSVRTPFLVQIRVLTNFLVLLRFSYEIHKSVCKRTPPTQIIVSTDKLLVVDLVSLG